jgi:hypothetical protein
LRAYFDALAEDASNMTPLLRSEVLSLKSLPFDDAVAEGPHARAKRILGHSRGAMWPWVASSCRLAQNLKDIRDTLPAVDGDLGELWAAYKSVLRVGDFPETGRLVNPRMPISRVHDYVYRMSFCKDPDEPLAAGGDGGDANNADDGNEGEDDGGGDDAPGDDGGGGAGGCGRSEGKVGAGRMQAMIGMRATAVVARAVAEAAPPVPKFDELGILRLYGYCGNSLPVVWFVIVSYLFPARTAMWPS